MANVDGLAWWRLSQRLVVSFAIAIDLVHTGVLALCAFRARLSLSCGRSCGQ